MELGICHSESGTMEFDNHSVHFEAGDIICGPRYVPHTTYSDHGKESLWSYIFFDPEMLFSSQFVQDVQTLSAPQRYQNHYCYQIHERDESFFFSLVLGVIRELRAKPENFKLAVKGLLMTICIELGRIEKTLPPQEQAVSDNAMVITGNIVGSSHIETITQNAASAITISGKDSKGQVVIDEDVSMTDVKLTVNNGSEFTVNGNLTMTQTAGSTTTNAPLAGEGIIYVTGAQITVKGSITSNTAINGTTVNAAMYTDANPVMYHYTTLEAALASGATKITVTGTIDVTADATVPVGTTVDARGATVNIDENATLTVAAQDRDSGRQKAYDNNDVRSDQKYVFHLTGHPEDGYQAINTAINKSMEFSAVVCFNDIIAMGVLKSLAENDLSVPNDVEVIGYDNLMFSQFMEPALTTVDVPKHRLGYVAMDILEKHINDPEMKYETNHLSSRLLFRDSTGSDKAKQR